MLRTLSVVVLCALVALAAPTTAAAQAQAANGNIEGILRPIQRGMLQFVGFDVLAPQIVHGPARIGDEERRAQLDAWRQRLIRIAQEEPIVVGQY